MMKAFGLLAGMKGLRGTLFDGFGYTHERREERRFLAQYEADIDLIASGLEAAKLDVAVALASIPSLVRGYGHVKAANMASAEGERMRLVDRWRQPMVAMPNAIAPDRLAISGT